MSLDALNALWTVSMTARIIRRRRCRRKTGRRRPLSGFSVLDATPVFRNTLLKYRALLAAGAELSVGVSDVVAKDPRIVDKLKGMERPGRDREGRIKRNSSISCWIARAAFPDFAAHRFVELYTLRRGEVPQRFAARVRRGQRKKSSASRLRSERATGTRAMEKLG